MATRKAIEPKPAVTTDPLHLKYRPHQLEDVLGQDVTVKSLKSVLRDKSRPHCFLLTGPAGTGKTTFSRILAERFGCDPSGITEIDAASNSGIEDMRRVTEALAYNGFGENPGKAIILNECQGLSKQAWDSLLTSTEEPPAHVFFFFTSTNPAKIPAAMVTRCLSYHLNPLKYDVILDLLEDVCKREGFDTTSGILQQVAEACEGSARAALTMLAKVHACEDPEDAADLLRTPLDNAEIIDICRLLVRGDLQWPKLVATIKDLSDNVPAETVRIIIVNYLNSCAMGAKTEKDAVRILEMLENFLKPCNPSDKFGPLLVAFGRYMFP